jgi:hypothetical protein
MSLPLLTRRDPADHILNVIPCVRWEQLGYPWTNATVVKSVYLKNGVSGMLRRVALVRTDVSEELSASFIRGTRIGELEITLAVTSNRRVRR